MVTVEAEYRPEPDPKAALEILLANAGGALHLVVVRAKAPGLTAEPLLDEAEFQARVEQATNGTGANQVLLWHATGTVPTGAPMAVVGATADHRREAFAAVDAALGALKGVARRTDLAA